MSRLRVESFTLPLDGFGAGPDQDLSNPLGVGGTALHGWALSTRTFQQHLFGADGVDLRALGYACTRHVASTQATHVVLSRQ